MVSFLFFFFAILILVWIIILLIYFAHSLFIISLYDSENRKKILATKYDKNYLFSIIYHFPLINLGSFFKFISANTILILIAIFILKAFA